MHDQSLGGKENKDFLPFPFLNCFPSFFPTPFFCHALPLGLGAVQPGARGWPGRTGPGPCRAGLCGAVRCSAAGGLTPLLFGSPASPSAAQHRLGSPRARLASPPRIPLPGAGAAGPVPALPLPPQGQLPLSPPLLLLFPLLPPFLPVLLTSLGET